MPYAALAQTPFYQGKTVRIINNDPGGTAGTRVKTVVPYLRKYIPGNPTIIVEFIEGGGGRRAANHVFSSAKPDGLTIGALSSSAIGLSVMRETGVMYDIDKFIYLGTPVSENHNVFYTRAALGLNNLEKLRAASGVKLGAQEVGAVAYISSRLFAYFLDLKAPKFVTGLLFPGGGRRADQWRNRFAREQYHLGVAAQSGMGGKGHHGFSRHPGGAESREASPSEVCAAAGDRELCQDRQRKESPVDVARVQNRYFAFRAAAGDAQGPGTYPARRDAQNIQGPGVSRGVSEARKRRSLAVDGR
jgi:hypothetical protein